jgi:predicted AAA+ superfamily ATPase
MISKEEIFEALADWNYWDKPHPRSVPRQDYENEIDRKAASGEIIILKGVRSSGKSTLMINEMKRLIAVGHEQRNILYINCEDPRFFGNLDLSLLEHIKQAYLEFMNPSAQPVIMLDEVQHIPGWEKWALKEYGLKKSRLYVSGSSSSLLSREIGTALSGRYLDIEVFPLSFREFLYFNGLTINDRAALIRQQTKLNRMFRRYMEQGGFPKLLEFENDALRRDTLKSYYDSILLRDIVARHNLANYRVLEELSTFLLANTASVNSTNKLKNTFGVSFDTVKDYTAYLEEACLIFQLNRFAWSVKRQLVNPRKFYSIDTGLSNRVSFQVGARRAQNIENIVFLELIRRKHDIYYYKTKNDKEVDFLVKEGPRVSQLIQVCYSIDDEPTRKRELSALETAWRELRAESSIRCLLLTMARTEPLHLGDAKIEIRNVLDWLLFPF